MYATNLFKKRALFFVSFALQMRACGRTEEARESFEKLEALCAPSELPQPDFQLFDRIKWKDTGLSGVVYGVEYIGEKFFYAIQDLDESQDTTPAEVWEIEEDV